MKKISNIIGISAILTNAIGLIVAVNNNDVSTTRTFEKNSSVLVNKNEFKLSNEKKFQQFLIFKEFHTR